MKSRAERKAEGIVEEEKMAISELDEQAETEKKSERKARRKRMTMQVMGISIIASALLILATKALFEEIFVEDDWSDVDWGGEEEDFGLDVN